MKDGPLGGDGRTLLRRNVLKGIGALGAGAAVGGWNGDLVDAVADATAQNSDVFLPSELVREYYNPTDGGSDGYSAFLSRGVSQTNMKIVPGDRAWRGTCNGDPGVVHRFTVNGIFEGVAGAELHVSLDGESCGRASLTPYYTWARSRRGGIDSDDSEPVQTEAELRSEVDRYYDETFAAGDPVDYKSFLDTAGLATAALAFTPISAPLVGAAVTVADVVHFLSGTDPNVHEVSDDAIDQRLTARIDARLSRFFWTDFAVVVPAGETATVTVEMPVDDTAGQAAETAPSFNDPAFTIEIPAVDDTDAVTEASVPTIDVQNSPIEASVPEDGTTDDRTVDLSTNLSDDSFGGFDAASWNVGEAGDQVTTSYATDGAKPISYTKTSGDGDYDYVATKPILVGDPPFDDQSPLTIEGPDRAAAGEQVSWVGTYAGEDAGVDSQHWQIEGREGVVREHRATDSSLTYTTSLPYGDYGVNLEITTTSGETVSELVGLTVGLNPSITGPDYPVVDTDETYAVEVDDATYLENVEWRGDVSGTGTEVTATFDGTGERTVEAVVTDSRGDEYTVSRNVTVVEWPTATVDGPSEPAVDQELTFTGEASSAAGAIESHEWRLEGRSGVETEQTGSGQPNPFTVSVSEVGSYSVVLEVTDDQGLSGSETVSRYVGLDPVVAGPTELVVNEPATWSVELSPVAATQSIEWSGDVSSTGDDVTASFDDTGERAVTVTVTDANGKTHSTTKTVDVVDVSAPTVTSLDGPTEVGVGDLVEYTGAAEAQAEIDSHEWRLEGKSGVLADQTGPGRPAPFEFDVADVGSYSVVLQVTDVYGQTGGETQSIDVGLEPEISGDSEVAMGQTGDWSVDLAPVAATRSIEWSGAVSGSGTSISDSIWSTGEQTVRVTVTDENGETYDDTFDVDVTDPPNPSASITSGPSEAFIGETVRYDGEASSSAGSIDSHEWIVTGKSGVESRQTGSGTPDTFVASVSSTGDYSVELDVTDEFGGSAGDNKGLAVEYGDVSVTIDGPGQVDAGIEATFTVTDASSDNGSITNYEWEVRDPDQGNEVIESASGSDMTEYTVSIRRGTWRVYVTATDLYGKSATDWAGLLVGSPGGY